MTKEEFMTKWVPTIVTLLLTIAGMFAAPIQAALSAHPTIGLLLGGIYAIIKGLLPSPVTQNPTK
jgi:hypothetical protein